MIELRVNTLKALPALKYLLADAGLEPPFITFEAGWKVFERFLSLPADSADDVAGFQAHWIRENANAPVFEVLLCRQLTDPDEGLGPSVRLVALQFLYESAPPTLAETEMWASDFTSLGRFLRDVERSPVFRYAIETEASEGDAILYHEDVLDAP